MVCTILIFIWYMDIISCMISNSLYLFVDTISVFALLNTLYFVILSSKFSLWLLQNAPLFIFQLLREIWCCVQISECMYTWVFHKENNSFALGIAGAAAGGCSPFHAGGRGGPRHVTIPWGPEEHQRSPGGVGSRAPALQATQANAHSSE